jgi:hypothetical protein
MVCGAVCTIICGAVCTKIEIYTIKGSIINKEKKEDIFCGCCFF